MKPTAAWRLAAWRALDPIARAKGLSPLNSTLALLIVISAALAVLETEPAVVQRWEFPLAAAEFALGAVFALEYLARLWIAAEGQSRPWRARIVFIVSPAGLADALAVLAAFVPFASTGLLLRLVRLLRLLRLAKLGRLSRAWTDILTAVTDRREALAISFGLSLVAILAAATALYLVEGTVQPDAFGSIPRATWWAVATLTTIGYGDAYPVTPLGKLIGAVAALASVGLVALPAGILAAAFSDAMTRRRG